MNKFLNRGFKFFSNKTYRIEKLTRWGFYNRLSDEKHLKKLFKARMGYPLNLEDPQTFNEKLQWLKLYDRKPIYTSMVDKYEVKNYVADIIGEEHIIPTISVWDKFDDIDFDALPNQFVLKCTHDSGGLVICKDKNQLNLAKARKKINRSLKNRFFYRFREWAYKDVKPRIIAERYMEDEQEAVGLTDYKFYCFDGEPKFLYVSSGLGDHASARISFLTMDWNFAPYERSDYAPFEDLPNKPKSFEQMVEICKTLSKGIPFLRVDLYEINKEIYFSELTFYPSGGFMPFKNRDHDLEIGNMITLPDKV